MRRFVCLTLFCLTLGAVSVALAAEECAALVENALDIAYDSCTTAARNTACYGNQTLVITPRPNVRLAEFARPGDIAPLSALESLELGNRIDQEEWGIALLQVQADLPDTAPGQNVTMVLFGAVTMQNAVGSDAEIPEVTPEATADTESEDIASYSPMQAFYLSTGIGDRPCAEAPDSGILVQTPEGSAEITLNVNGVTVHLGSTAYLQSAGGTLRITVIEGTARVTAAGVTQTVPAGAFVQIPLTPAGQAVGGAPAAPQAYEAAPLQTLPVHLLPLAVTIAPPADAATLTGTSIDTTATYQTTFSYVLVNDCADWDLQDRSDYDTSLSFAEDGAVMNLGAFVYARAGDGSYTYQETFGPVENQTIWTYTIQFTAPGAFEGEMVATWNFSPCVPRFTISGTYSTGG